MYLYYIENLLLICVRFNTETTSWQKNWIGFKLRAVKFVSRQKKQNPREKNLSFAWGARLVPLAIMRPCLLPPPFCFYPMWVLFALFCGLFSVLCGYFCCPLWVVYSDSRGWFVVYVDRLHLCVGVLGGFSLDLYGSLVHDELFNGHKSPVGSGNSSQFEIFLVTPLEIWG